MKTMIILATSSPYRIAKFKNLGIPFESRASDIDEKFIGRPKDPKKLVLMLSKMKAENVAKRYNSGIIIGFDTVAFFNGEIHEKLSSKTKIFKRLKSLSGKKSQVITGIYIIDIDNNKTISKLVKTDVYFRKINDDEINFYIKQDKLVTTYAIGYDPEGNYSSTFVKKINGSYNNSITGMPIETIVEILIKNKYI